MTTGYTTVAFNETVTLLAPPPTFQIRPAMFAATYTAPAGKRWIGTAYPTYASDGTDAEPTGSTALGDGARVTADGTTARVRATIAPPSGYVAGTPLAIVINVAAIDE